jgi:hypothetical protein
MTLRLEDTRRLAAERQGLIWTLAWMPCGGGTRQ